MTMTMRSASSIRTLVTADDPPAGPCRGALDTGRPRHTRHEEQQQQDRPGEHGSDDGAVIVLAAGPLDQPVGWLICLGCLVWLVVAVILIARGDRRG